jgi:hypothetical protein
MIRGSFNILHPCSFFCCFSGRTESHIISKCLKYLLPSLFSNKKNYVFHYVKSEKVKNGGKPSSRLETHLLVGPLVSTSPIQSHWELIQYTLPLTPHVYFSNLYSSMYYFYFHLTNQLI